MQLSRPRGLLEPVVGSLRVAPFDKALLGDDVGRAVAQVGLFGRLLAKARRRPA